MDEQFFSIAHTQREKYQYNIERAQYNFGFILNTFNYTLNCTHVSIKWYFSVYAFDISFYTNRVQLSDIFTLRTDSSSENEVVVPNGQVGTEENSPNLIEYEEIVSERIQTGGDDGNDTNTIHNEHAYAENAPTHYPIVRGAHVGLRVNKRSSCSYGRGYW